MSTERADDKLATWVVKLTNWMQVTVTAHQTDFETAGYLRFYHHQVEVAYFPPGSWLELKKKEEG
jgi:hypothetical protein